MSVGEKFEQNLVECIWNVYGMLAVEDVQHRMVEYSILTGAGLVRMGVDENLRSLVPMMGGLA